MLICPICGAESPDRYRACGRCGSQLVADRPPEEIRRVATVVTSDWKGSTALGERLDPESLREVQTRYFDAMQTVFESHGGTIEKIIGDAIVAVFGIPTRREDDALRAVQAAAETQRVLAVLNDQLDERWGVRLITRTGVATGEVIVGEATAGQHVLTGDTMSVATAMEQNAPAQETLLAGSSYRLVAEQVQAEAVGPITPKGSHEPVTAYRLVAVASAAGETAEAPSAPEAGVRVCGVCGEQNPIDFLHCGACGATLTQRVQARESRKTVTIVFADPKPDTADGKPPSPEALRDVMSGYFNAMQAVLARHGATVEKFIGDAVMAVFGLPVRHDEDALRAVRAAADMQRALPDLNEAFASQWGVTLGNHIGVNTGEVVAGDASLGQRLVTGDTVNVAARLEQAAGAGQVLLGDLTYRLVRGAVEVEVVEPLTLKGKAEPVPAYRLQKVSDATEGFVRRQDAPMIGRQIEMDALKRIYRRTVTERGCRMATVVADAGVGKSRLIDEFAAACGPKTTVIRGRCLPYGEGITFWPLREAARDAAGVDLNDPPDVARSRLDKLIGDEAVSARIASAIGLATEPYPVAEIFWGARRFLESLGRKRPLVVVIHDIHWAEPTFLEMIGNLIETIEDASVLLLCSSRPDLLEAHPEWATAEQTIRVVLQPLTDADAGRVVQGLLGGMAISGDVANRIAQGASGNPLFVEQLLSMLIDAGTLHQVDGHWEALADLSTLDVPPTIQALLAARLDLLAGGERAVIEPASVIGQTFAQAAVTELAPDPVQPEVPMHLVALTRKQFVQPEVTDEPGYRFPNLLIRDAAYHGLLKRARADLHERFVNWGEEINRREGRGQEFEEIQGYHLEQAYRYLTELGTVDDHARSLGIRASEKLASSGRRAMARGDMPAAANLLRRAAATRERLDPARLVLLPDLGEALTELGEFDEARLILADATDSAAEINDELVAARAGLVRLYTQLYSGESEGDVDWSSAVMAATERALALFEAAGEEAGQTFAWRMRAMMFGAALRTADAAIAAGKVVDLARRSGNIRAEMRGSIAHATAAAYGPTPVDEALRRSQDFVEHATIDQHAVATINLLIAQLHAMRGDLAVARDLYRTSRAKLEELRAGIYASSTSIDTARIEMLAGDDAAAEADLRRDYAALTAMGEKYALASVVGLLARVLERQGRSNEALEMTRVAETVSAVDDVDAQSIWRGVRARIEAERGETTAALALAREAVELRRQADMPILHAEALMDLAAVLDRSGASEEAMVALDEALVLAVSKGDVITARQIKQALARAKRAGKEKRRGAKAPASRKSRT
jgi:class 3 adenylate cyclase/tetratricopeptide (TPR) repeat protein